MFEWESNDQFCPLITDMVTGVAQTYQKSYNQQQVVLWEKWGYTRYELVIVSCRLMFTQSLRQLRHCTKWNCHEQWAMITFNSAGSKTQWRRRVVEVVMTRVQVVAGEWWVTYRQGQSSDHERTSGCRMYDGSTGGGGGKPTDDEQWSLCIGHVNSKINHRLLIEFHLEITHNEIILV